MLQQIPPCYAQINDFVQSVLSESESVRCYCVHGSVMHFLVDLRSIAGGSHAVDDAAEEFQTSTLYKYCACC